MILPELSAYLVANITGFVAGPSTGTTQVWLGRFPEASQGRAIALFESGGVEPQYTYSDVHERPSVQVISRSTSYAQARLGANQVWALLAAVENDTLSSVDYVRITPLQSPFDIGTDPAGRSMLSCNYTVEKAVSLT